MSKSVGCVGVGRKREDSTEDHKDDVRVCVIVLVNDLVV
jgi:hypothetical protein